jgi:hypothetical protein
VNPTTAASRRDQWANAVKSPEHDLFKGQQIIKAKAGARRQVEQGLRPAIAPQPRPMRTEVSPRRGLESPASQLKLARQLLHREGVLASQVATIGQPRPDLNAPAVLSRVDKGVLHDAPKTKFKRNKTKVAPDTALDRIDSRAFRLDVAYQQVEMGLKSGSLRGAVQKELAALKRATNKNDRKAYVARLEDLMDAVEAWTKSGVDKTSTLKADGTRPAANRSLQRRRPSSAVMKKPAPAAPHHRSRPDEARKAFLDAAMEASLDGGAGKLVQLHEQLAPHLSHLDETTVSALQEAVKDASWQVFALTLYDVIDAM